MEKAKINGKIYDILDFNTACKYRDQIDQSVTAIKIEDSNNVLPIRNKTDMLPGVYFSGDLIFVKEPDCYDAEEYSSKNIINFDDAKSLKEIIKKQDELNSLERSILTNPDNIFIPSIGENDSPEMAGLKAAVTKKNIDLDKYAPRFGSNYSNDKRLFNDSTITMSKMKTIMKNLDMKGTLIIEDIDDKVPNPIGEKIVIDLVGGDTNE